VIADMLTKPEAGVNKREDGRDESISCVQGIVSHYLSG